MSGAIPGNSTAGARTLPCDDTTSTMSPCAMPRRPAVPGLISTQLLHIADVSGSGISCSHGRCATDPSPNCCDRYGRKWNGYSLASPSNRGSNQEIADCGLRTSTGSERIADCGIAGGVHFATVSTVL